LKVLLLENISAVAMEQFRAAGYEVESHKPAFDERDLVARVRDATILGVRSKTPVSRAVMEAAERLLPVLVDAGYVEADEVAATWWFTGAGVRRAEAIESGRSTGLG